MRIKPNNLIYSKSRMQRGPQRQWYFFYSIFCPHSRTLRDCISRGKYNGVFQEVCVDPQAGTNQRPRLPPFVKQVPTIYVDGQVMTGKAAFNFVNGIQPGKDTGHRPMSSHDGDVGFPGMDTGGNFTFLDNDAPGRVNIHEEIKGSTGAPSMAQQNHLTNASQLLPGGGGGNFPQDNYMNKQPLQGSNGMNNYMQQQGTGMSYMSQQPDRSMPPMGGPMMPHLQNQSAGGLDMDYDRLIQQRNQEMQQMGMRPKNI